MGFNEGGGGSRVSTALLDESAACQAAYEHVLETLELKHEGLAPQWREGHAELIEMVEVGDLKLSVSPEPARLFYTRTAQSTIEALYGESMHLARLAVRTFDGLIIFSCLASIALAILGFG